MLQFKSTKSFIDLEEICLGETAIVEKIFKHLTALVDGRSSLSKAVVKPKGYSPASIVKTLFLLPWLSLPNVCSIYLSGFARLTPAGKDVFYGFKNNSRVNWRKFLTSVVKKSLRIIRENTDPSGQKGVCCFIVDDTTCEKTGKRMAMIGRVFDHVTHRCVLGFKFLALGYWDGRSFLPVDFSIHGEKGKNAHKPQNMSKKELNRRFQTQAPDGSPAQQRKDEYFMSKVENATRMIKRAVQNGLVAQYVLADSWFINEPFIQGVRSIKKGALHIIGMCAVNKLFVVNGRKYTTTALIAKHQCTKKTSREFRLQYFTLQAMYKGIPLKLFFVKQGLGNQQTWKLIVTTDLALTFRKAIETYQIRWTIEVFFKEAKQNLALGKSQSNYFNAQIADTTICFAQYILLVLLKRFEDYETIGGAFRDSKHQTLQRTLADRILQAFIEIIRELVELLELDYDVIMQKLLDKNSSAKITAILNVLKDEKPTKQAA